MRLPENERTVTGMAEYIERGALEIDLNGRLDFLWDLNGIDDHYTMGFFEAVIRAKEFPSADVAPVIHAHWVHEKTQDGYDLWKCSHCGAGTNQDPENILLYCFHCGAKMMPNRRKENDYEID